MVGLVLSGFRGNATHMRRVVSIRRDYQDGGPIMTKLGMLGIIGGAAILTAAPLSLQWSQKNVGLSLDSAEAQIGQPTATALSGPRPGRDLRCCCHPPATGHGHSGQADCARVAMAERVRGETNRHDPTGMRRPPDRVWRGSSAANPSRVFRLL
jgi:hypothetical protein